MTRFTQKYFDQVTRAVEEVEEKTSAELVVAIHPQSGTYRDIDYLFGALLAFAGLLFIVFNPWTVHLVFLIPFEVALLFVTGSLASAVRPWIRRRLSSVKRREGQVRSAAGALFVEEGVANTRRRTGVLVHLSRLERQVEVIADIGVERAVKPERWGECIFALKKIGSAPNVGKALLEGIARLGEVLSEHLPPEEDIATPPGNEKESLQRYGRFCDAWPETSGDNPIGGHKNGSQSGTRWLNAGVR